MSHFTVAVITKDENKLEEILAPYSENLEVPRYVKYTKEQLIQKVKGNIEEYKNSTYAEFLKDPIKYKNKHKNKEHIKYLEEEFPKCLNWTNEEIYQEAIKHEEESNIGANGEIYSTYNPNSKWDWYEIGGRWYKSLLTKKENEDVIEYGENDLFYNWNELKTPDGYKRVNGAKIKDIDFKKMNENQKEPFYPWALVDKTGWYEQGEMYWWGYDNATEDSTKLFIEKFKEYIKAEENQDKYLIIVDCHI